MATRATIVLTCDQCEAESEPHDADVSAIWMIGHGWRSSAGRDLCPTCLMDRDAKERAT